MAKVTEELRREIESRAHDFEGQGDGIYMVLIRLDAIAGAFEAIRKRQWQRTHRPSTRRQSLMKPSK